MTQIGRAFPVPGAYLPAPGGVDYLAGHPPLESDSVMDRSAAKDVGLR